MSSEELTEFFTSEEWINFLERETNFARIVSMFDIFFCMKLIPTGTKTVIYGKEIHFLNELAMILTIDGYAYNYASAVKPNNTEMKIKGGFAITPLRANVTTSAVFIADFSDYEAKKALEGEVQLTFPSFWKSALYQEYIAHGPLHLLDFLGAPYLLTTKIAGSKMHLYNHPRFGILGTSGYELTQFKIFSDTKLQYTPEQSTIFRDNPRDGEKLEILNPRSMQPAYKHFIDDS